MGSGKQQSGTQSPIWESPGKVTFSTLPNSPNTLFTEVSNFCLNLGFPTADPKTKRWIQVSVSHSVMSDSVSTI